MTDDTTKGEPVKTLVNVFFDLESDGRLTVRAGGVPEFRLSGDPASVFRDLGPRIARWMMAEKIRPPQFEVELAKWMKEPEVTDVAEARTEVAEARADLAESIKRLEIVISRLSSEPKDT